MILILKPGWKGEERSRHRRIWKGWETQAERAATMCQLEKTSRVWPEEPHRCLVSPESRNSNGNQPGFPSWEDSIDLQPGWVTEAITHQGHESDVTCGVGTASWRASPPCQSLFIRTSLFLCFLPPLESSSPFSPPACLVLKFPPALQPFPPLSRADTSSQIPARNNKIHMLDFFFYSLLVISVTVLLERQEQSLSFPIVLGLFAPPPPGFPDPLQNYTF